MEDQLFSIGATLLVSALIALAIKNKNWPLALLALVGLGLMSWSAWDSYSSKKKREEIVSDFSALLKRAHVIHRQCQGAYQQEFKAGETIRTKYDTWYQDVKDAFRSHRLNFDEYHTKLEDVPGTCDPGDLDPCKSNEHCQVLCELLPRRENLSQMIDEFRGG